MNTLRIYIVGVGGQGPNAGLQNDRRGRSEHGRARPHEQTHGMAQRGGVVESTVVLGAQSPTISDNCADILLAFEPMEAVRA